MQNTIFVSDCLLSRFVSISWSAFVCSRIRNASWCWPFLETNCNQRGHACVNRGHAGERGYVQVGVDIASNQIGIHQRAMPAMLPNQNALEDVCDPDLLPSHEHLSQTFENALCEWLGEQVSDLKSGVHLDNSNIISLFIWEMRSEPMYLGIVELGSWRRLTWI